MSLGNKYLNNTILARYHDDTTDAILSKTASNLLVSFEQQGYQIINTKDFYPNTIPESKYACYDAQSLKNFLLYHDAYFQLAFEKYDDLHKVYKAIVRNFLLKVDGSVYIKQVVYAYPRSIFTLSDIDRATYTKTLLALPGYNEFTLYYSSIYALRTTSPSLPIPCTIGIGSGCFLSELEYFSSNYNRESSFGNQPQVVNDRQDLINGFYYLAGEDLTSIAYPLSTNYIYNSKLYNKPYSTGSSPYLNGTVLHYIADNETIKNNQTFWDTQSSPQYKEPSSVIQPPSTQVSSDLNDYQQPTGIYGSSYGSTPTQYGNPDLVSGVNPEDMGYYDGKSISTGVLEVYNMLCPPGFSKSNTNYNGDTTVYPINNTNNNENTCQCSNSVI